MTLSFLSSSFHRDALRWRLHAMFACALTGVALTSCSSDATRSIVEAGPSSASEGGLSGDAWGGDATDLWTPSRGGPLPLDAGGDGAGDHHCTMVDGGKVIVMPEVCMPAGGDTGRAIASYGATLYGSEGDDDGCKYHVSFSATCYEKGRELTFTLRATSLTDGSPVVGANPRILALMDSNVEDTSSAVTMEQSGTGMYTVTPVSLHASGIWTIHFNLFPSCEDTSLSPRGHIAFFVKVP